MSHKQLRQRLVVEGGLCVCGTKDGRPKPDRQDKSETKPETKSDESEAQSDNPETTTTAADAGLPDPPAVGVAEAEVDTTKRWCMFDEAAEYFSRHATRRVLRCSTADEFATLLESGKLAMDSAAPLGLGKCTHNLPVLVTLGHLTHCLCLQRAAARTVGLSMAACWLSGRARAVTAGGWQ